MDALIFGVALLAVGGRMMHKAVVEKDDVDSGRLYFANVFLFAGGITLLLGTCAWRWS